ncbi:MAG: polysaccharide deacetylase family protein [Clostridia bacterium]|nr:polysaccharide deacetylase family protein [Clostridia bacterium]
MKRILIFLIISVLLFSLCSCADSNENVSSTPTGEEDVRTTEADTYEYNTEIESVSESAADTTLTGLPPLKTVDFQVSDPDNTKGLSTEKISHSYGVAKNEVANDISFNSQKHFDDGNFKALTLDTKIQDKVVYLTFDVGYDNGYTGMILDTLKEKNVPAAFFCTVGEMKSDPDSITRMINEGHIVGNHTDTHPSMDELSRTEMMKEIKAFDDYIRTNFGYSSPYFRFPKGEYSDCALDLVGSLGYTSVFWSLAYADWDTSAQKGAQYAVDTVISRIHPGAVILLHAVSSDNAQGLGEIIDTARSMGYEFRSLDEYKING